MRNLLLLFFLFSCSVTAQVDTEIHVFDIKKTTLGYELVNGKNISNNKGYDSQPFFYENNQVIFSSNKRNNTDILWYNLDNNNKRYLSNTTNGGEYSPQRIPNTKDVSAVRLDNDGLQRFYSYDFKTKKFKEILPNLKVAYPIWHTNNILVASVIVRDSLHLIVSDLKKKKNTTVAKLVGRSNHKIPNSNSISFISKENGNNIVKSLDIKTNSIQTIINIGKSEDTAWLPDGTLLFSRNNFVYKINPSLEKNPSVFYRFTDENINNISRIAVNYTGTKIALVAEVSPRNLAEEQLKAYNNRDIEAFLKPFAKNVKVYRFPNVLNYEGIENMRKRYAGFFKNTTDLHCKILKRIVFKNKVIDHELVTANGKTFTAVAIYEMNNGKITSVTFM